jgi:hypothetical protein|tara:strand:- start:30807 stop:31193 length:387 start_codon:yes stop_codon:yes gene_type:complete
MLLLVTKFFGAILFATYLLVPTYVLAMEGMYEFLQEVGQIKDDRKLVPPADEIRKYEPQPNRLMLVKYANDRLFLFRIEASNPKPECNQVKRDNRERIIIITQDTSQAYEYILEPLPIYISEWANYER